MKKHVVAVLVLLVGVAGSLGPRAAGAWPRTVPCAPTGGDPVLAWNEIANDAMVTSGITPLLDPLHEARLYAMMHIAVHDALNAIDRRSRPYALDIGTLPRACPDAAVATAAHDVLVPVLEELPDIFAAGIPAAVKEVEAAYTAALATVPDGKAKKQGEYIGRAAAAVINAMRADDGADTTFLDSTPIKNPAPGDFQWVAGADFNVAPKWGDVTPFVMKSGAQFRPQPPYDLTSEKYAADFNELKELGSLSSTTRTATQTQVAFFWFESSPMRWNRIARTVSVDAGLDMWANARLFGLLNVAQADGYIGNWESKRFYNRWRPETAVRLADTDGNPDTIADKGWTPLWGSSGATPEYDSGHTIEGAAAAVVLADVFGTDHVTFDVCSYTFGLVLTPNPFTTANNCDGASPIIRTFDSFSGAAEENGLSRIWIGWHFRNAVEAGHKQGTQIGNRAVNHFFKPIH
jgi:PAP2 superfamily protein